MAHLFSGVARRPLEQLSAARIHLGLMILSLMLLLVLAGCRSGEKSVPGDAASAVRMVILADGLYEASSADLREAGFDLTKVDPRVLSLTTGGQPVSFEVAGEGSKRVLRFYGQALGPEAYTAPNVYWLSRSVQRAAPLTATIAVRPAGAAQDVAAVAIVSSTVRAGEQRQWAPKAGPGDDRWMWRTVFAPGEVTITLNLPHATPGQATLRVQVWGNSSAPVNPDHRWVLSLNGVQVAEAAWDGPEGHSITATVPAGIVGPGDNQLIIRAPGDTGAPADLVFLDWVEISYDRELVADAPEIAFQGQAPGYEVRIAEPPVALWDVTDPAHPVALQDFTVENGSLRFGATSNGALKRYLVVMREGLRRPAAITAAPDPDGLEAGRLRNWPGGADLIVVTAPQFRDALEPLVKARQAQGLRVAVVELQEVYDAFSYGRASPVAIRDLVRQAVERWAAPAPRYLLLAGDASYDPRGYLKAGDKSVEIDVVPTALVATDVTGWTASDVWFALPDGVGLSPYGRPSARPALAVGRLPAQNAGQMAAMVAKLQAHEKGDASAPWRRQAFLVADNDEAGFVERAKTLAGGLAGYDSQVVTVDKEGAAHAALQRAFAEGAGLISYLGHGSLSLWAQEKILTVEEVTRLANKDRLPLVLTLTCLSGFFQHPTTASLGEALLRAPNGGAAAVIAPTSASTLDQQSVLADGLAKMLSTPDVKTIGDALLGAQSHLVGSPGGTNEILLTYNLLGDPSMPIR